MEKNVSPFSTPIKISAWPNGDRKSNHPNLYPDTRVFAVQLKIVSLHNKTEPEVKSVKLVFLQARWTIIKSCAILKLSIDDNFRLQNNFKNSINLDYSGLETLLLLDGEIFPMSNGYWTKFEVKQVKPNEHIPHGVKYSLTLHDRYNKRIIGYDNAHATKPKRRKFGAKRLIWDHKHNQSIVENYEFESARQLLADFWKDVNDILEK